MNTDTLDGTVEKKQSSAASAPPARTRTRTVMAAAATLLVLTLAAILFSVLAGNRFIPLDIFLQTIFGNRPEGIEADIIDVRIGRTLWGLIIGASLGLAGAGMQGVTRNPLGDPGILGVNAGAAFAVVLGITFLGINTTSEYSLLAFVGALAAASLVYALASIGRDGATPVKLALMGAALSAGIGSLTSALILSHQSALDDLRRWQVGSIAGRDLENLMPSGLLLLLGAVILLTGARTINNLALGDDMAASLGENVNAKRLLLIVGVTLLCGVATALVGPIAFLGLMAPHAMRAVLGADYRVLLPASAVFGAIIILIADTLGRFILPVQEIQVGVSTIVVGVPVFIYLVRTQKAVNL